MSRLFILGNGFDLAHGLKTTYEDFHDWLLSAGRRQFVDELETLYPSVKEQSTGEWCGIETALGDFDMNNVEAFDRYYSFCMCPEETKDEAYDPGWNIKAVTETLCSELEVWVEDMDYAKVQKIFCFEDHDLFITFNYTQTLEKVYHVPSERLFHIHGTINTNKELIIGYMEDSENNRRLPRSFNPDEATIRHNIMTNMIKPVRLCLFQLSRSSLDLSTINNVVVFGHSCSEVDKPYFVEVSKKILDEATWIYYSHDDSKRPHYKRFAHDVLEQSGKMQQKYNVLRDDKAISYLNRPISYDIEDKSRHDI